MKHKTLAVGIVLLFLFSSISSTGYETNVDSMITRANDTIVDDFEDQPRSLPLVDAAWPMKCHDLRHTAQSPYSTEDNPYTEKWRFKTEWWDGTIESSPVISNDGTIYFGSMGTDHKLYAINPDGTKKWSYEVGLCIWGASPAIAEDGTVYVPSWDGYLHAVYPNGTRKWQFGLGGNSDSSPAIDDDGTIYFGSTSSYIYAVNPNGTEKWRYQTGGWTMSDPAIGNDGTIYIGSYDNYLYALNRNGTLKWRFGTGDRIRGHPSIAEDGTIYIPSWDDYLYAIHPNGRLRWKVGPGLGSSGSAAIAENGIVYMTSDILYAIYPNNGTIKWSFDIEDHSHWNSPAISADGTIYLCNWDGKCIIAVNSDGMEKWRKQICNLRASSSPIIGEDGTIYVGSSWKEEGGGDQFGYLHAFGRGPLIADAGGPYSGDAGEEIQFTGTVFGGIPEYSYHWDFGDGNISDEECPSHSYGKHGEYIANFTVIDGEENSSSDTANVTVGTARPVVKILKPENGLYLFNVRVIPLSISLIIGRINIKVESYQEDVGIEKVEFYIDHELRYTDYDEPYSWMWNERVFFNHRIAVYAISNDGKSNGVAIEVWKFF